MRIKQLLTAVTGLAIFVATLTVLSGATRPATESKQGQSEQKPFDEMKVAFTKLADDYKQLTDQFKELQDEHEALKKRFDETSETTDSRVKDLEKVKAGDRLTKIETDLTSLNNTFNDRTSRLRAGGTAIDMGISEIRFQPDGNVVIVGKRTGKPHWASGTDRKD